MTTLTNKTRTTKPSFVHRQEGVKGQNAVAPLFSLIARITKRNSLRSSPAQQAVEPVFLQAAEGESGFYEIPAYIRKRIFRLDDDNRARLAEYAERVRAHIGEAA
tara:strand:- start:333 stop:647 length:315 start_codon:yes stop_codon:yes gene_type:complete